MKKRISHFYFHYPFCTSRCGYCSFYTEQFTLDKQKRYLNVIKAEILEYQKEYELVPRTLYFGGGSPSLLPPNLLTELIDLFSNKTSDCEITIECNPITLTPAYIKEISTSDINRISLGIQSMNKATLSYIGRRHKPQQVRDVIKNLREYGFHNISGDLIYGIPYQKVSDVRQDIDDFISLDLDHISIYCLSLDENAPLARDKDLIPNDDIVADMYQLICNNLDQAGFDQYEISNFAKSGNFSRHNLAYWNQEDYLGLGAGAYGTIQQMRYNNRVFSSWEEDITNKSLFPNQEILSDKDRMNEFIMLQLRLNKGLDPQLLKQLYKFDLEKEKKDLIHKFIASGLLEKNEKRLCLTDKSRFISNYIISELMED